MSFTPLHRSTLSGQIMDQLRDAIAQGRYAPGSALPSEREMVGLFGASRIAVREAMVALQAQGLVERAHGRAARVAEPPAPVARAAAPGGGLIRLPDEPTEANVRDVKQARLLLEVETVRLAALSIDAAGSERLQAALQANRDAISRSAAFLSTDMALHAVVAGMSGNALYMAMSREMLGWLARLRIDVVHLEGSDMLSYREHARIVERIIARDADGAAQAMVDHLTRSHQAYGRLHSLQVLPEDGARRRLGTS